ncbi:hypothetical protein CVT25_002059 [Psilocybe cyanescens]|uniref:Uncharacterized protein n=1 Tax=Psilocybe cyanescens TaxID=93625 RepID=A0A409X955_PSICY|nr:hypothetical protein CVT25_002059 [Psilocybe cyanescens]
MSTNLSSKYKQNETGRRVERRSLIMELEALPDLLERGQALESDPRGLVGVFPPLLHHLDLERRRLTLQLHTPLNVHAEVRRHAPATGRYPTASAVSHAAASLGFNTEKNDDSPRGPGSPPNLNEVFSSPSDVQDEVDDANFRLTTGERPSLLVVISAARSNNDALTSAILEAKSENILKVYIHIDGADAALSVSVHDVRVRTEAGELDVHELRSRIREPIKSTGAAFNIPIVSIYTHTLFRFLLLPLLLHTATLIILHPLRRDDQATLAQAATSSSNPPQNHTANPPWPASWTHFSTAPQNFADLTCPTRSAARARLRGGRIDGDVDVDVVVLFVDERGAEYGEGRTGRERTTSMTVPIFISISQPPPLPPSRPPPHALPPHPLPQKPKYTSAHSAHPSPHPPHPATHRDIWTHPSCAGDRDAVLVVGSDVGKLLVIGVDIGAGKLLRLPLLDLLSRRVPKFTCARAFTLLGDDDGDGLRSVSYPCMRWNTGISDPENSSDTHILPLSLPCDCESEPNVSDDSARGYKSSSTTSIFASGDAFSCTSYALTLTLDRAGRSGCSTTSSSATGAASSSFYGRVGK